MRYYRRDRRDRRSEQEDSRFKSEVLYINRVAKVLKGGRRFRFTALVAVGDGEGTVGLGLGKAPEVVEAIHKGEELAKKNIVAICRAGTTIPFGIKQTYCSTTVVLRPAREGAGITAGGPARPLLALAGLSDCSAKFFGSGNRVNCARAIFEALKSIESPEDTLKHRRDRNYRVKARHAMRQPAGEDKEAGAEAAPEVSRKATPPKPVPAVVPAVKPVQADARQSEEAVESPVKQEPSSTTEESVTPTELAKPEGGAAETPAPEPPKEPDSSAEEVSE